MIFKTHRFQIILLHCIIICLLGLFTLTVSKCIKHAELLHTDIWWCVPLSRSHAQWRDSGGLRTAGMGTFTPQRWANVTNQVSFFFQIQLLNIYNISFSGSF